MKTLLFAVLVAWLVAAPLLLGAAPEIEVGGATPFARFLSGGGAYAAFLGFAAVVAALCGGLMVRHGPAAASREGGWLRALLLLTAIVGILQLLPLPAGFHRLAAPAHAADVEAMEANPTFFPTSTDLDLTDAAILRLIALFVAASAALLAAATPRRAALLLAATAAAATLSAAYGVAEAVFLSDTVLGFPKPGDAGAVTGTFFYRGNFAAFAASGAGIAAALFAAAVRRRRPLPAALLATALVIIVAAVILSRSRAGLVATGLAAAAGLVLRARSRTLRLAVGAGVVVAVVGAGLLFGDVRQRFAYFAESSSSSFLDVRIPAWESTLELFAGRPALGTGLGTFRRAIHLTQSPRNPDELWFAHSDPLNLLAEGGVPGFLLGGAFAALGLLGAARLARRGDPERADCGAAAAAGLAGLFAMALVDFPLQIPALVLLFVVLSVLPAALAVSSGAAPPASRLRRLAFAAGPFAVAGVLLAAVVRSGGEFEGERRLEEGRVAWASGDRERGTAEFEAAVAAMPFEGEARYHLAIARLEAREFEEWQREIRAAHRLARGRAALLFAIGEAILGADRTLLSLALDSLREAVETDPSYYPRALAAVPAGLRPAVTPDAAWAQEGLGDSLTREGLHDLAIAAYRKALDLGGGGQVPDKLAAVYRAAGREEEGRRRFAMLGLPWPPGR